MSYYDVEGGSSHSARQPSLETIEEIQELPFVGYPARGFGTTTAEAEGVRGVMVDGTVLRTYYPYPGPDSPTGYKCAAWNRPKKASKGEMGRYYTVGDMGGVKFFGQQAMEPNQYKDLIILESEDDRLALIQWMSKAELQNRPDIICMPTARVGDLLPAIRSKVLKYRKIILAFDAGPAEARSTTDAKNVIRGKEATALAYSLLQSSKVHFLSWPIEFDEDSDGKVDGRDWVLGMAQRLKEEEATAASDFRYAFNELVQSAVQYKSPEIFTLADFSADELRPTFAKGVSSSFAPITAGLIGGWGVGNLGIITAPVGSGKTTFVIQTALDLITNLDLKVGLIALENTVNDLTSEIVALDNNVNPNRWINNPALITNEQIEASKQKLANFPIVTGDRNFGRMDYQGMESLVLEMMTIHECDVVFFDNVTAVAMGGKSSDQRVELERTFYNLAQISRDQHKQVVVVVQLNREFTRTATPLPEPYLLPVRKENLKGSAAIEGTAAWVLCLCPEINPDGKFTRTGLHVDKARKPGTRGMGEVLTIDPITGVLTADTTEYKWPWEIKR